MVTDCDLTTLGLALPCCRKGVLAQCGVEREPRGTEKATYRVEAWECSLVNDSWRFTLTFEMSFTVPHTSENARLASWDSLWLGEVSRDT